MKNVKVVIGANFGDEGKGLMVDYLASKSNHGIVVRFNSGCQCGHTVVTPESRSHVFGHFGAGSFCGLPTYLSKHVVVNPIRFCQEYQVIQAQGVRPTLFVDPECFVTTPYDMMINQIAETSRGDSRHGSCGIGFNETIVRSEMEGLCIKVKDLEDYQTLEERLQAIREEENVRARLDTLGVKDIPEDYKRYLMSDEILKAYMENVQTFLKSIKIHSDSILKGFEDVIFEGGQGLMLDQNYKFFPYVTHSNTGMKNVREILWDKEYSEIEVIYVSRTYVTRHGAGNFPTESKEKPYKGILDLTNLPNQYQGALRLGYIDPDELLANIKNDLKYTKGLMNLHVGFALTCVDQSGNFIYLKTDSGKELVDYNVFLQGLAEQLNLRTRYVSFGMSRETVAERSFSHRVESSLSFDFEVPKNLEEA